METDRECLKFLPPWQPAKAGPELVKLSFCLLLEFDKTIIRFAIKLQMGRRLSVYQTNIAAIIGSLYLTCIDKLLKSIKIYPKAAISSLRGLLSFCNDLIVTLGILTTIIDLKISRLQRSKLKCVCTASHCDLCVLSRFRLAD